jgi:hypothetical protein
MSLGGDPDRPWGDQAPQGRLAQADAERALEAAGYRSHFQRFWDRLTGKGEERSAEDGSGDQ